MMKNINDFINESKSTDEIQIRFKMTNECYDCAGSDYSVGLGGTCVAQPVSIPQELAPVEPEKTHSEEDEEAGYCGNLIATTGRSYEFGTAPEIQIGTVEYNVREDIYNIVKKVNDDKKIKLSFNSIVELRKQERYFVARIYGGLNGKGKWIEYNKYISKLFEEIEKDYHCWMVQLLNDCLDDVFTLEIGVRWKESDEKKADK